MAFWNSWKKPRPPALPRRKRSPVVAIDSDGNSRFRSSLSFSQDDSPPSISGIELLEDRRLLAASVFAVTVVTDQDFNATDLQTAMSDGGGLSLREAVRFANQTSLAAGEKHHIIFDLGNDPSETHTISLGSDLTITNSVVIDGYSQMGATPNTLEVGNNAELRVVLTVSAGSGQFEDSAVIRILGDDGLGTPGFGGSNSEIRGLVLNDLKNNHVGILIASATGVQLAGNYIGTDAEGMESTSMGRAAVIVNVDSGVGSAPLQTSNTIGGLSAADRNVIAGEYSTGNNTSALVLMNGVRDNVIVNNYLGTDKTGNRGIVSRIGSAELHGVYSNGNTSSGGNAVQRNIISAAGGFGINWGATSTSVQNGLIADNLIGVGVDGKTDLGASQSERQLDGLHLANRSNNVTVTGNVIGFSVRDGVHLEVNTGSNNPNNNWITGNWIGIGRNGANLANGGYGINVLNGTGTRIFGNSLGFNLLGGIEIAPGANTDNAYGDMLPAVLAPFAYATESGGLLLSGNITGAGGPFFIEVFASQDGQGHRLLQSIESVTLLSGGFRVFLSSSAAQDLETGDTLVVTATRKNGNSSEFSNEISLIVVPTRIPDDVNNVYFVTNTSDSGSGSLRKAINDANASEGTDAILFAIPNPGTHIIELNSGLPTITDRVYIDGFSQDPQVSHVAAGNSSELPVILRYVGSGAVSIATLGVNNTLGTSSAGSTLRGLVVQNMSSATGNSLNRALINVQTDNNIVEGNRLGTNADGSAIAGPNLSSGIRVLSASGTVIRGNQIAGISNVGDVNQSLRLVGASKSVVAGNYIGTDATGTIRLSDHAHGILINGDSHDNTVGGLGEAGNVITADNYGIWVQGTGNHLYGNFVGVDRTATLPLGVGTTGLSNQKSAINIEGEFNTIGLSAGWGNFVGRATENGIRVTRGSNLIEGNWIGISPDGVNLSNGSAGVSISGGIGTAGVTVRDNAIAYNLGGGIVLAGTSNESIRSPVLDPVTGLDSDGNLLISGTLVGTDSHLVEVYIAHEGQGRRAIGNPQWVEPGTFVLSLGNAAALGVTAGDRIVTTSTNANGSTSAFSPESVLTAIPITTNFGFTRLEDTSLEFKHADFFAHFADTDGDPLTGIRITSLPTNGILYVGTNTVIADTLIAASDIDLLRYEPDANWSGQTTITYQAFDGAHWSNKSVINVTVTPDVDLPEITIDPQFWLSTGTSKAFPDGWITFGDPDGSEQMVATIAGVPDGISFNAGTNLGNGVWSFRYDQLADLRLDASSLNTVGYFTLTINAESIELATGESAMSTQTIRLFVVPSGIQQVYVVTNTDGTIAAGLVGSLGWAVEQAQLSSGYDAILFDIHPSLANSIGDFAINLNDTLAIASKVYFDGLSQAGAELGSLRVVIDNTGTTATTLQLATNSGGSTVRGLVLQNSQGTDSDAAALKLNSSGNRVAANHFGTDSKGMTSSRSTGYSIYLQNSRRNTIGGDSPEDRNVFGGDFAITRSLVYLTGTSTGNEVLGNYFGVGVNGATPLLGSDAIPKGIRFNVTGASANKVIGNVFAGLSTGIEVISASNTIQGNILGFAADGLTPRGYLPDSGESRGILLSGTGATSNLVGGSTDAARNVIGNLSYGIRIMGGAGNNQIAGNYIGVDASGQGDFGFTSAAIHLQSGDVLGNTIGGPTAEWGNIIGNGNNGIAITNSSHNNLVQFNRIGIDVYGNAVANDSMGIRVSNSSTGNALLDNSIAYNLAGGINISGANENQAAPTIFAARLVDGQLQINLNVNNGTTPLIVQIFRSLDGQGIEFIGEIILDETYDLGRSAIATLTPAFLLNPGDELVATATRSVTTPDGPVPGSTSRFSNVFRIQNDPPVMADIFKSGLEDTATRFDSADFDSLFTDANGDSLTQIRIDTLPTNGLLWWHADGTQAAVFVGQIVDSGAIGHLRFEPNANWSGFTGFTFSAFDGWDWSESATATLEIAAVADLPKILVQPIVSTPGVPAAFPIVVEQEDSEGSESILVRIEGLPNGTSLSAGTIDSNTGVWTLIPAELAGLTISIPESGRYTLTVTATSTEISNGSQAAVSATLNVRIKTAPALSGTFLQQSINDDTSITPFANVVTLAPDAALDDLLTLTITLSDSSAGQLVGEFNEWSPGVYSLTATLTELQAALTELRFIPSANSQPVGIQSIVRFTLDLDDGLSNATNSDTILTVTSINDVPVVTGLANELRYSYGTNVVYLATVSVTVTDPDIEPFGGGRLAVRHLTGGRRTEFISMEATTDLHFVGQSLYDRGVFVGTLISDGQQGEDWILELAVTATPQHLRAVLESLTYRNSDPERETTLSRGLIVSLEDGEIGPNGSIALFSHEIAIELAPKPAPADPANPSSPGVPESRSVPGDRNRDGIQFPSSLVSSSTSFLDRRASGALVTPAFGGLGGTSRIEPTALTSSHLESQLQRGQTSFDGVRASRSFGSDQFAGQRDTKINAASGLADDELDASTSDRLADQLADSIATGFMSGLSDDEIVAQLQREISKVQQSADGPVLNEAKLRKLVKQARQLMQNRAGSDSNSDGSPNQDQSSQRTDQVPKISDDRASHFSPSETIDYLNWTSSSARQMRAYDHLFAEDFLALALDEILDPLVGESLPLPGIVPLRSQSARSCC